jgi:hypothetical protein
MENKQREFLYKIGEASVYRIKDKLLGYRYVLVDGPKERLFDSEKEMKAIYDTSQ